MISRKPSIDAILNWKSKSKKMRLNIAAKMIVNNLKIKKFKQKENRRSPRNCHHRNRGYALEEMNRLNDREFQRMFRLSRNAFHDLEKLIEPIIQKNSQKEINCSGSAIPVRTRLAVTLRWLAGGQQIDLCFGWGISKTVFYSERGVLWPTSPLDYY
jgi:hypothetical protein